MGRIVTPKYRVEAQDNRGQWQKSIWRGRVSQERLQEWRRAHNEGFQKGGVNFHVSKALGCILHYSNCRIVNQYSGEVVCEFKAPLFEAV